MYLHFYPNVYMLLFTLYIIMSLHPLSRGFGTLSREIHSIEESLDEFNACDYVKNKFSSYSNDLCIVQLNIRGIASKQSQLKYLIDNCIEHRTPDIIILYETWLTPFSPQIEIQGYEFCHRDHTTKCGGGVTLLLSNRIRYKLLENIKLTNPTFEHLSTEISPLKGQKLIVSSIY